MKERLMLFIVFGLIAAFIVTYALGYLHNFLTSTVCSDTKSIVYVLTDHL